MKTKKVKEPPTKPDPFTELKAKREKRREAAQNAAITLVLSQSNPTALEHAIESAHSKMACYCQTAKMIEDRYEADGTAKPPKEPSGRSRFSYRVMSNKPGFSVCVCRKIGRNWQIEFTSESCVTISEARKLAETWATENNKVPKFYRLWLEGERDHEADAKALGEKRTNAIATVTTLLKSGKNAEPATIEELLVKCHVSLETYIQRKRLFDGQWAADGKWIGPKRKPAKKPKPEPQIES